MAIPYFKTNTNRTFQPGKELPVISEGLNSVRSYGFELHFPEFPVITSVGTAKDLTLAVKQVGGIGSMVQEIEASFGFQIRTKADRTKLSRLIFRDEQKRQMLNHIVHPYVFDQIEKEKKDLSII